MAKAEGIADAQQACNAAQKALFSTLEMMSHKAGPLLVVSPVQGAWDVVYECVAKRICELRGHEWKEEEMEQV